MVCIFMKFSYELDFRNEKIQNITVISVSKLSTYALKAGFAVFVLVAIRRRK